MRTEMEIMSYLCRAEQPARALRVRHDRGVNKNSTAFSLVSIEPVRLKGKCLLIQLMKRKSV